MSVAGTGTEGSEAQAGLIEHLVAQLAERDAKLAERDERLAAREEKLAEREGEAVELAADREWTIKALVRTCCANRPVPRRRARVTPC